MLKLLVDEDVESGVRLGNDVALGIAIAQTQRVGKATGTHEKAATKKR